MIRSAAKVSPMTMPRNFALSPISILIAIHDTVPPPLRFKRRPRHRSGNGLAGLVQRGQQPRAARQNDVI